VPVLASVNETSKRQTVPGFACVVHVLPPSVVLRIVLSPPIPHAPPTAVPAVCRPQNGTAFSHSCSVICIGKRNATKLKSCPACLRHPVGASVRGRHDGAAFAN